MAPSIDLSDPVFQTFRISPIAFRSTQITLLTISTLLAFTRTFLRFRRYRRLNPDDFFLIIATLANVAGGILSHFLVPQAYMQLAVETFKTVPPEDFFTSLPEVVKLSAFGASLGGITLLGIKLSFVCFFRAIQFFYCGSAVGLAPSRRSGSGAFCFHRELWSWNYETQAYIFEIDLVKGVSWSQKWWLACLILVIGSAVPLVFMPLYFCSDYGDGFWTLCSITSLIEHESIYLKASVSLDIFSDIVVVSIPIALLYKVKIALNRKVALGLILGLSIIMIIIALIRIAFVELPGHIPDTVWLYLWASVETSLSIIVVSIVAFRALLGHGKSKQKQSPSLQGWKQTNWSPPPLPLVSDTGSDYSHALSGDSRNRSFTVNTSLDFEISGQTKVVEVATIHHHHIYHRRSRLDWMSTFCGLVVTRRAHKINEKRPSRSEAVTPPQVHELEEIHVQELEESCVYELESGIVH